MSITTMVTNMTASAHTIDVDGEVVTLTYNATDCPRGIGRSTTGNKVRVLKLTCLK